MVRLFWIGLGGALGTIARYGLYMWCQRQFGTAFPFGTLAVNAIGSFLLGGIMHVGSTTDLLSPMLRLALGVGVMGGFTTYSTFNYETFRFFQAGAWVTGILNVLVTVLGCMAAGLLGFLAARRFITG
jgi:CrcB protein